MLDQIVANHPGQVAPIVWHISSAYPLYSVEGNAKMRQYPPPYWYNSGWYYATPWLWVDGKQRGYDYNAWNGYVETALSDTSDIQVNLTGTYDPGSRAGQIQAEMVSASGDATTARLYVVVTEDSLYHAGPNGQSLHYHVCRDYIPDQNGTDVTIPANGADTVVTDFTLDPSWVQEKCNIVVYVQTPTVQPDSSKPCYNGGFTPVMLLTGIKESGAGPLAQPEVRVTPNPCRTRTEFSIAGRTGQPYDLRIYSSNGSLVNDFSGRLNSGNAGLVWSRTDHAGRTVPSGVYAYRLTVGRASTAGKIVVTD